MGSNLFVKQRLRLSCLVCVLIGLAMCQAQDFNSNSNLEPAGANQPSWHQGLLFGNRNMKMARILHEESAEVEWNRRGKAGKKRPPGGKRSNKKPQAQNPYTTIPKGRRPDSPSLPTINSQNYYRDSFVENQWNKIAKINKEERQREAELLRNLRLQNGNRQPRNKHVEKIVENLKSICSFLLPSFDFKGSVCAGDKPVTGREMEGGFNFNIKI